MCLCHQNAEVPLALARTTRQKSIDATPHRRQQTEQTSFCSVSVSSLSLLSIIATLLCSSLALRRPRSSLGSAASTLASLLRFGCPWPFTSYATDIVANSAIDDVVICTHKFAMDRTRRWPRLGGLLATLLLVNPLASAYDLDVNSTGTYTCNISLRPFANRDRFDQEDIEADGW